MLDKHNRSCDTLIPLLNKTNNLKIKCEEKGTKSFKLLDQQSRRVFTAVAVLVATIVPALSPVLVSAAQLTTRSITLSSSNPTDSSVTYKVDFTPTNAGNAVVIDFCDNSPLVGDSCTTSNLTGFSLSSAAASGWTKDASSTATRLVLTGGTITASTDPAIVITGVTNPTNAGTYYARIVTYAGGQAPASYTSTVPGTHEDDGGVAISINSNVSVNAAVLESMTFCISGETLGKDCVGSGAHAPALTAPTLTLGETTGTTVALLPSAISTGSVYTQLSTNAVGGAVVNIKSANTCGGLMRVGAAGCDIPPTNTTTLTAGTAGIGVQLGSATGTLTSGDSTASGLLEPTGNYSNTGYALGYINTNATGVTSAYGDPILTTNNTVANNTNNTLQFGATISNQTPAGKYSNSYSLIATGKF